MTAGFLEAVGDVSPQHECAGCGMRGDAGQCGVDAAPVMLGYRCGCLQALSAAMGKGWTFRGTEAWARARREGRTP